MNTTNTDSVNEYPYWLTCDDDDEDADIDDDYYDSATIWIDEE